MNRFVWMLPVAFALGFAVARTSRPQDRQPLATKAAGAVTNGSANPRATKAGERRQSPASDRVKGYMRRIDEAATTKNFSPDLLKDVPTDEIPLLIEQWKKRAGFSGLDYKEQFQIKRLAKAWYEKEPQAALDWAAGMECRKDRQDLISEMVGAEAKRNFDHALELAKRYGKVELGGLNMPHEIQEKLGQFDPARLMEILRMFPSTPTSNIRGPVDFKANFDFATMAELMDHPGLDNKEQTYAFFPSNFVSEWAKIDLEAAWTWLSNQKENSLAYNGIDGFFTALSTHRTKEEINQFVIDQMTKRADDDSKFRLAWQALTSKPDSDQIADFINRLPGDRGVNLERLAQASVNGSGGPYDQFKEILVAQMTAAERRQVLSKVFASSINGSDRGVIVRTLRQLGHTDAEINETLPALRK